jgi:AcrR family transcriptional regulator
VTKDTQKEVSKKKNPKKPNLSREVILQQALLLADSGGIEALSMRKLADALGVKAMSLYNHFANKDEILDGLVETVIAEIEVPNLAAKEWKVAMLVRANSAHRALLAHPWATQAVVSRMNIGPNILAYIDATLGCLCKAGFSIEMADHIWNAMDNHIYGFTLQELNFPLQEDEYTEAAAGFIDIIPVEKYPHMNALSSHVMQEKYNGIHDFEFGLKILLRGLEGLRD